MAKSNTRSGAMTAALLGAQAVLVALTVYLLVRAVILFVTPQSVWQVGPMSTDVQAANTMSSQTYAFNFDPFHRDVKPVVVDEGSDAPETTLNLKMVGRRAGEGGSAIILTPDRKQGVYRVGDEIISGVILKSVTPDYIVLSQGGRLERLTFERSETAMTMTKPNTGSNSGTRGITQQSPTASQGSVNSLMAAINLERVTKDGDVKGYKIVPRQSGASLSAFGLQTGDIITRIENEDLTAGRPNLSKLFADLSQRSSANVTLIRDGQTLTVKVGQ